MTKKSEWTETQPETVAQMAQSICDVLEMAEATNTDSETTRLAIRVLGQTCGVTKSDD